MTALNHARRHADSEAQEIREDLLAMADKHENFVLVLDGLREAIGDARWGDFSVVADRLQEAAEALGGVYANQREAA